MPSKTSATRTADEFEDQAVRFSAQRRVGDYQRRLLPRGRWPGASRRLDKQAASEGRRQSRRHDGLLNGLPDDAPPLAFPHSSQVDGPLRELRSHYGKRHIRILYERSGNLFVLLHALDKAGKKLPEPDIRLGQERMKDFQARMNANPRVPPRAAGRDAPSAARRRSAESQSLE